MSSKSKAFAKAQKAYVKRSEKYEAKARLQAEKKNIMLESGKEIRCSTCGGTDHERSTSKLCMNRTEKRKAPKNFKRTSVIKASLINTCRSEKFVEATKEIVKHVRDITYAGSLLANFFFVKLLSENRAIPPITHDLCYGFFSLVAGKGMSSDDNLQEAYANFKSLIPEFKEEKFISQGYMTILSTAAKEYEESIRNHITANFEPKTIQYLLVCMSDQDDKLFRWKGLVKDRKTLASFMYNQACGAEAQWPTAIPDNKENRAYVETCIESLKTSIGVNYIDEKKLNAEPHLFFPWIFQVLKRLEQKVCIAEATPQKYVSTGYVHRMVQEVTETIRASIV